MKKTILPIILSLFIMACQDKSEKQTAEKGYKTPADLKLQSDIMTPEVLWSYTL